MYIHVKFQTNINPRITLYNNFIKNGIPKHSFTSEAQNFCGPSEQILQKSKHFCPQIIAQNGDFQCTDLQGSDDIRKLGTTHDAVVHDESGRDKKKSC